MFIRSNLDYSSYILQEYHYARRLRLEHASRRSWVLYLLTEATTRRRARFLFWRRPPARFVRKAPRSQVSPEGALPDPHQVTSASRCTPSGTRRTDDQPRSVITSSELFVPSSILELRASGLCPLESEKPAGHDFSVSAQFCSAGLVHTGGSDCFPLPEHSSSCFGTASSMDLSSICCTKCKSIPVS